MTALLFAKSRGQEVVIVSESHEKAKPFIDKLHEEFMPFTVSLLYKPGDEKLAELVPFVKTYNTVEGKPSAYICEGFACKAPVTELDEFIKLLE